MGAEPPPLEAADIYLFAFGNGAIFLYHPDARSRFVVLAEAVEVATACGSAGGRVFLGGDSGEPLADHVLEAVRGSGATIVDYDPPVRPYQWELGGDALMVAAGWEQDELLDDLLARGADVSAANEHGSTALHHAAGFGNLYAIDRLLAAGADAEVRNQLGLTPHMLAMERGHHEAAMRLEAAGATPVHLGGTSADFRWSHRVPLLGASWVVVVFAVIGLIFAWPPSLPVRVLFALGGAALGVLAIGPSRAVWTSVVPRRLDGAQLQLRTFFGRPVVVDLDAVTQAAYGAGGGGRGGRLVGTRVVLVHPEGRSYRAASLRRKTVLGPDEVASLPDPVRATVVVLDPWWEHEVLRPVGDRLGSGIATTTPRFQAQLERARLADPATPVNRPGRLRNPKA